MLRRCVWSRNIKNGCSIYIYDISHLRVKFYLPMSISVTQHFEISSFLYIFFHYEITNTPITLYWCKFWLGTCILHYTHGMWITMNFTLTFSLFTMKKENNAQSVIQNTDFIIRFQLNCVVNDKLCIISFLCEFTTV